MTQEEERAKQSSKQRSFRPQKQKAADDGPYAPPGCGRTEAIEEEDDLKGAGTEEETGDDDGEEGDPLEGEGEQEECELVVLDDTEDVVEEAKLVKRNAAKKKKRTIPASDEDDKEAGTEVMVEADEGDEDEGDEDEGDEGDEQEDAVDLELKVEYSRAATIDTLSQGSEVAALYKGHWYKAKVGRVNQRTGLVKVTFDTDSAVENLQVTSLRVRPGKAEKKPTTSRVSGSSRSSVFHDTPQQSQLPPLSSPKPTSRSSTQAASSSKPTPQPASIGKPNPSNTQPASSVKRPNTEVMAFAAKFQQAPLRKKPKPATATAPVPATATAPVPATATAPVPAKSLQPQPQSRPVRRKLNLTAPPPSNPFRRVPDAGLPDEHDDGDDGDEDVDEQAYRHFRNSTQSPPSTGGGLGTRLGNEMATRLRGRGRGKRG